MESSIKNYFEYAQFQPNKDFKVNFRKPKPLSRKNTNYLNFYNIVIVNDLYDWVE